MKSLFLISSLAFTFLLASEPVRSYPILVANLPDGFGPAIQLHDPSLSGRDQELESGKIMMKAPSGHPLTNDEKLKSPTDTVSQSAERSTAEVHPEHPTPIKPETSSTEP